MSNRSITFFPIAALLLCLIAYYNPGIFAHAKGAIIPLLALVMFFMGMTLSWHNLSGSAIAIYWRQKK